MAHAIEAAGSKMSHDTLIKTTQNTKWLVESIRATIFAPAIDPPQMQGLWSKVTGEEPEAALAQAKKKLIQEEGPIAGGRLVVALAPARADFVLGVTETNSIDDLPVLGSFEAVQAWATFAERWMTHLPDATRLAFGVVLLQRADSRIDGYTKLATSLPTIKVDVEGSRDFFYQINRPRMTEMAVGSLLVNRLSKWTVARRALSFNSVGGPKPITTAEDSDYAVRLELDISTPVEHETTWPAAQSFSVLKELIRLASEIGERGDTL